MLYKISNHQVIVGDNCFVAPTAAVIGEVEIKNQVSIWFGTVVRGDTDKLYIGECSNIQDNSTVHTDAGIKVIIGRGVTVGHNCVIHGCTIDDNTLIGMGSTILNNVQIGKNCIIGANSLITQGTKIPDNSLVLGSPGKFIRKLSETEVDQNKKNAKIYVDRALQYIEHFQLDD